MNLMEMLLVVLGCGRCVVLWLGVPCVLECCVGAVGGVGLKS